MGPGMQQVLNKCSCMSVKGASEARVGAQCLQNELCKRPGGSAHSQAEGRPGPVREAGLHESLVVATGRGTRGGCQDT